MKDKELWGLLAICAAILLLVVASAFAWGWYKAGLQTEVYKRQGVEMTQWEVFNGIKPIERTINIK